MNRTPPRRDRRRGSPTPIRSLRGFQRVHLRACESRQVRFTLGSDNLPESGKVEICVVVGQPVGDTPHLQGTL